MICGDPAQNCRNPEKCGILTGEVRERISTGGGECKNYRGLPRAPREIRNVKFEIGRKFEACLPAGTNFKRNDQVRI